MKTGPSCFSERYRFADGKSAGQRFSWRCSALLMAAALWAIFFTLHQASSASDARPFESLASSSITLIEFLIFGTLMSLIERRPLWAIVKAVAIVFAVRFVAAFADNLLTDRFDVLSVEPVWPAITVRMIAGLIGIAAIVPLTKRWFAGASLGSFLSSGVSSRVRAPLVYLARDSVRTGNWRRLFWFQYRGSFWAMFAATLIGILLTVSFPQKGGETPENAWLFWLVSLGLISWIGSMTFHAAREQLAFLTTLGAHPHRVWLSQLLAPFGFCSVFVVSVFKYSPTAWANLSGTSNAELSLATMFVLLAAFAWSQWCSQRFRSVLTSFAVSFAFSLLAIVWISTVYAAQLTVVWFVLPAIVYPLLESFVRSAPWMRGISMNWFWLIPKAIIAATLVTSAITSYMFQTPYYSDAQVRDAVAGIPMSTAPQIARFEQVGETLMSRFAQLRFSYLDSKRDDLWVKGSQGKHFVPKNQWLSLLS